MKRNVDPKLIGGFVLGAIALLVAGIILLGGGYLFAEKRRFVLFFKGSVQGLNVGSPVVMRGVRVGSVKNIQTRFNPEAMKIDISVIIVVDPQNICRVNGSEPIDDIHEHVGNLVEHGLRAQLQSQSLITGQLMIALDFHPETPANLAGYETDIPELPTIPSAFEEISSAIRSIPLEDVAAKTMNVLDRIEGFVASANLGKTLESFDGSMQEIRSLVRNLDASLVPMIADVRVTLDEIRDASGKIGRQIEPVATDLRQTLQAADAFLAQSEQTFAKLEKTLSSDSSFNYELTKTLRETNAAARSIRGLFDYLQRYPDALVRGKADVERTE